MFKIFAFFTFFCLSFGLFAQETGIKNAPADYRSGKFAFTNATIQTDYQTTMTTAVLLINAGKVENVGKNLTIPKDYQVVDLKGKYIYPSMVDIYSDYGIEKLVKNSSVPFWQSYEQFYSNKKGAYAWNEALKPEIKAQEVFLANEENAKKLREAGFGAVSTHHADGIARGTSALVSLGQGKEIELILKANTAAHYSFAKGVSSQPYPASLMGSIALLRQTHLDGIWYKTNNKEFNNSLESWNNNQSLPQIFEVSNKLNVLRADKIGDEFGKQFIIRGSGDEYQRIAEIKATNANFILPVNFPDAIDVSDPYDASYVSLSELKHWELAPTNPAEMAKANIEFAFTANGLKSPADFLKNVRKAIEYGLDKSVALKAITFTPAKLINSQDKIGSLKNGMIANFIICSKELFDEKNIIYENWIQGKQYVIKANDFVDLRGDYKLSIESVAEEMTLKIGGDLEKQTWEIFGKDTVKAEITQNAKMLSWSFVYQKGNKIRLTGWANDTKLSGEGQLADGNWTSWTASKTTEFKEKEAKKDEKKNDTKPELGKITYPFMAFGWTEQPAQETLLIKNTTVWTNENEGVLENTDVLIKSGKIEKVGKNLTENGAKTIDGTGKHLTAGIIDEHSHIGVSQGVNEGVYTTSAEVRIADVVNSEDINIYRQLSGGVVAAQLLHGSANAIGGQSALIKFRWGMKPEDLKIKGADEFIKFALGENPKRSNTGSFGNTRFPQTRMGMEQVYVDAFTRAREYEKVRNNPQTRKDLGLEAVLEILNKKRYITCHSYVQSEINMLMKVAERFNFNINTFTHILEGYKLADKMKAHGVHASSFADWWAYKYEVLDAIPYNAALLTQVGVTTAINSDDAEMGRRLNQEAAKTVKYGNVSEIEAMKMPTLNAAIMLHLDKKMGSIKAGKDADVVLWSTHPLSVYAKSEKTIVDGIVYFDREKDAKMRLEVQVERNRLIQKMMLAKAGGAETKKPDVKKEKIWHCEDVLDIWNEEEEE